MNEKNEKIITPFLIKYKPKNINDFHFDNNIKDLIIELINTNNINVLFYCSNETGKTSLIQTLVNTYFISSENFFDISDFTCLFNIFF